MMGYLGWVRSICEVWICVVVVDLELLETHKTRKMQAKLKTCTATVTVTHEKLTLTQQALSLVYHKSSQIL
jgi:hypothetical protein